MTKFASKVKKNFEYATAEESRKPGYLAAKFARIRADQRREAEAVKVAPPVIQMRRTK